jgi:hypothetical protein
VSTISGHINDSRQQSWYDQSRIGNDTIALGKLMYHQVTARPTDVPGDRPPATAWSAAAGLPVRLMPVCLGSDLMMNSRLVIIFCLALGVLVEIFGFGQFDSLPTFWVVVIRIALFVVLGLLAIRKLRKIDQAFLKQSPQPFARQEPVDSGQVDILKVRAASKVVDKLQAQVFALAITAPAEVRKRITEVYTIEERTVRQTVTIDAEIPRRYRSPGDLIYFPVSIQPKGNLLDGWSVTDSSGDELPCLTYREYLVVAASVLRLLLSGACLGQPNADAKTGMTTEARIAEDNALQLFIKRNLDGRSPSASEVKDMASRIRRFPCLPKNDPRRTKVSQNRELAAQFVEKLSRNYVVIAPAKTNSDGRLLLKYEQKLIPNLELGSSRRRGPRRWLSALFGSDTVAFGAQPVDLTISVQNAYTCQSFHLYVDGPEGLYLSHQEAIDFDTVLSMEAKDAPSKPTPRFRRRLGQSFAHFYVRYLPENTGEQGQPRIRFRYAEVPPGSLFRATIAAVASFFLIWVIGALTTAGDPHTDVPVLLLAFPAAAAAWLEFERPSRRLLEATLPGRVCLAITVLLSLASAALFMAHQELVARTTPPFHWWSLPHGLSVLWVGDVSWVILILLALANMLIVGYKCLRGTWQYCYLSSRQQDGNALTRQG